MNRTVRAAVAALLAASLLAGCMGRFALTDKVYDWNKTAHPDRWVREGIFVVFLILPVYGLTFLADGILFNSVEWWTGRNPVLAGEQRRVHGIDGSEALLTMRADGVIDVEVTAADGTRSTFNMARETDTVVVRDAAGTLLGTAAAF